MPFRMEFNTPPGGGFLLALGGKLTRGSCPAIASARSFSALRRIASIFCADGPAPSAVALGFANVSPVLYVVVFPVDRDFGTVCKAWTGRTRPAPVDSTFGFFGFKGS